jgi:hypothetical protein
VLRGYYLICSNRAGFQVFWGKKKEPSVQGIWNLENQRTISSGYLKPWESKNHQFGVFETLGIKEPSTLGIWNFQNQKIISPGYLKFSESKDHQPRVFETFRIKEPSSRVSLSLSHKHTQTSQYFAEVCMISYWKGLANEIQFRFAFFFSWQNYISTHAGTN